MFHNKKFKLINVLSNSINIKLLQYKWTTTRTLHSFFCVYKLDNANIIINFLIKINLI